MRRFHLLFSFLAFAACHGGEPAPQRQPAASVPAPRQAPELGPHQSPVSLQLVGPAQVTAGQDIEVVARVARRVRIDAAVTLELALPEGARLVSGNPAEVLPLGNGVVERRFVVHLDRVPTSDLQVVAKTSATSFGARASSAYRFGRPEPRFGEPPRSGKQLKVGGRDVGTPIKLAP